MAISRFFRPAAALALLAAIFLPSRAADTVKQAFEVARSAVSPQMQAHVVSVYGVGTPEAIGKWYVIFYDPAVATHGRVVLVDQGRIVRTYPANGGAVYKSGLAFDPARLAPEGPALDAAQAYAANHQLAYDGVRALLKQSSLVRPFRWRVELMQGTHSRGFVYVNASDSSVASYAPPGREVTTTSSTTTTRSSSDGDENEGGFAGDVKRTFLGIGGDLQEFFTGERTVDK